MCKYCLLIFFTLGITNSLFAQFVRKISYEESLAIALGESYTARYYREDVEATLFSYLYTRSQFKPMLNFNVSTPSWEEGLKEIYQADGLPVYNSTGSLKMIGNLNFTYVLPTGGNFDLSSRMYYENFRTTLAQEYDNKLEQNQVYSRFALSFSQPVFTANKLKENMKVAELNYRKSLYYFTRTQMDIVYSVTASFYHVYRTAFEHRINQERLENSRETFRITKLKQETGNLPEGESLIAEITVAQDEARVMESSGNLATAYDDFKLLIGLELDEAIELEADMEFESFLIDLDVAVAEALQNRPEIQENLINIELQEIEVKRAKREREFKGNLSAYYDFTGLSTLDDGSLSELTRSAFENMRDRPPNRGVVFTVSYPLADWGRAKNLVNRESRKLKQQLLNADNDRRIIEKDIRKIVRTVYEAEERYRINTRNREAALQSYRISQLRFENGDMTSQELSIEQERLSQIQLSYIDSYITYRLAVADLNRKTMYDFENNRSYNINN